MDKKRTQQDKSSVQESAKDFYTKQGGTVGSFSTPFHRHNGSDSPRIVMGDLAYDSRGIIFPSKNGNFNITTDANDTLYINPITSFTGTTTGSIAFKNQNGGFWENVYFGATTTFSKTIGTTTYTTWIDYPTYTSISTNSNTWYLHLPNTVSLTPTPTVGDLTVASGQLYWCNTPGHWQAVGTGTGTGTVTLVSGTANRISVVNGSSTPTIDIDSAYVGQSSITTLGTIVSGTWNGTEIDLGSYVTGNLGVSHLNSGTGASASTFWRGDGTWASAGTGTVTSVAALTLGTSGTDLSSTVANSTTTPVITLNVPTASASNRGALSSTDWTTFNNKFTLPSLTAGSVLFSNGTTIAQDNANFFWDDTNNRLGIGTATPTEKLHLYAPTGNVKQLIEVAGGATTAMNLQSGTNIWSLAHQNNFHSGNLLLNFGGTNYTSNALEVSTTSQFGFKGVTAPTAIIHIGAGTATAGTAPLKFTSGTNLTAAEAGAFEYDGNSLFFTPKGTLRSGILMTDQTNFNTYTQASKGATAFTSGTDNFLAGYIAGGLLTTGSQNVAIGNYAGYNFSNALGNVAIGYWAGRGNASVEQSVFIGYQSGMNATNASYSQFIGGGGGATNAQYSFFGGYSAGSFATGANNSVFLGYRAGNNATGAAESIFIGKQAGYNVGVGGVTGVGNIAIGLNSGMSISSGTYNTLLGYKAGDALTTGSKNVALGYNIDLQSNTADGQLTIQNAIFGTGNTGTGTTASTGKIGIYTVAPTCALDVTGGIATSRTAVTSPTATDGNIFSGTYTPTITGVTNVSSSTAYACQYMRVGNVVTVSGQVAITATTNNAQTTFGISLPIASNFANTYEAGGGGYTQNNTVSGHGINLSADVTNDRINADYFETHGGADTFNFTFTYQIK